MRKFLLFLLFGLLSCHALHVIAQPLSQKGPVVKAVLPNDLNILMEPIASAPGMEFTLFVKTGSIFENDSMHGIANVVENIIAGKIAAYLRHNKDGLLEENTFFSPASNTERAIFRLNTVGAAIHPCLQVLHDSIFNARISEREMTNAVNAVLQQIEDNKRNPSREFDLKLLNLLYVQDHEKLEPLGNPAALRSLSLKTLLAFYSKYYVPNNCILTVTGNFNPGDVNEEIRQIFLPLIKAEFDPEIITKVHPIRPIAFAAQFIQEDTVSNPLFEIFWQYPGSSSGRESSYPASLLCTMLNDQNNFIRLKLRKMGCRKFTVQYAPNVFNGILHITLQPSRENFFSTYRFVMKELTRLDETLLNIENMNVAKLEFKQEYAAVRKTKDCPEFIVKGWSYNDPSYYEELNDSVYTVTFEHLRNFIIEYMNQRPPVTGLRISKADREAMQVDTAFTDLDESVGKYVFKYKQNITGLEGAENLLMLRNLLQWLRINDDIIVQVNGFSDEHEYNRASDDTILQFIDSIPTFFDIKRSMVKKGFLRPETMRAMKIIKYLYDHGIAAERLTGTSMTFRSSNSKEQADNEKCTLTLNKYHKSPSVYEYHFGKKKPAE